MLVHVEVPALSHAGAGRSCCMSVCDAEPCKRLTLAFHGKRRLGSQPDWLCSLCLFLGWVTLGVIMVNVDCQLDRV